MNIQPFSASFRHQQQQKQSGARKKKTLKLYLLINYQEKSFYVLSRTYNNQIPEGNAPKKIHPYQSGPEKRTNWIP